MKQGLSVLFTLLFTVSLAVSQSNQPAPAYPTNYNIAINMKSGSLNFGETAFVAYTIKDALRILSVITTNYDFYKTSLEIQLTEISTNTFVLKLRSYEVSNFLIPALLVTSAAGNMTNTFYTPEIPIDGKAMQNQEKELLPIMEIYDFPDWFWLVWAAGGLALAAGIFFLIRVLLSKRKPKRTKPQDPYEYTLRRLRELKAKNIAKTDVKLYFSAISEIDREFLENVMDFPALEMSTSEIYERLKDGQPDEELTEINLFILKLCDHVKYAKHIPTDENVEQVYMELIQMVERVKMIKTRQAAEEEKGGNA